MSKSKKPQAELLFYLGNGIAYDDKRDKLILVGDEFIQHGKATLGEVSGNVFGAKV